MRILGSVGWQSIIAVVAMTNDDHIEKNSA